MTDSSEEYTIQDVIDKIPEWDLTEEGEGNPEHYRVRIADDEIVMDAVLLLRARNISDLDSGKSIAYVYTTNGTDSFAMVGMLQQALWEQQADVMGLNPE